MNFFETVVLSERPNLDNNFNSNRKAKSVVSRICIIFLEKMAENPVFISGADPDH